MGIWKNIIEDIKKPRPKFRIGDKVRTKISKKEYIVTKIKFEENKGFICTIQNEKEGLIINEAMIEKIKMQYY